MSFCLSSIILLLLFTGTISQENAQGKLSSSLLECYNNTRGLLKENRLPHNMHSFIAIVRKIEDNSTLQMDLRVLAVALLHRFRQDGIVFQPLVDPQPGVTPYAVNGFQFYRFSEMLKLIPGNAQKFPNDSISHIERCSLHSMVSSTVDTYQRGDESSTCRTDTESTRIERSLDKQKRPPGAVDDVETLSPEEIKVIEETKDAAPVSDDFVPSRSYPEFPPNHPKSSPYLEQIPISQCPSEGGVIKTDWGVVAGGPILAGIAAALQPQNVRISDLMLRRDWSSRETLRDSTVDNKWIATLAGDLLEVVLRQGPQRSLFTIGTQGHFNSSTIPKYYFLNNEEDFEMTAAELRGDIDGLVLANQIDSLYKKIPSIKLSQILDMYYSDRGLFNTSIRACNRRNLFKIVANNQTIWTQTHRAALILQNTHLSTATISPENIEKYTTQVTNELFDYVPTLMEDKTCPTLESSNTELHNRLAVDLTIFVDTTWPFNLIKPILHSVLEKSEINKYSSNFTLINAASGEIMINTTNSILDMFNFNETQYAGFSRGFDFPKSLMELEKIQTNKLNRERDENIGGGRTDVVLIIPHSLTSLRDTDRDYSLEMLTKMRTSTPDTRFIFLTGGAVTRWSNLVVDSSDDVFSVGSGTAQEIRGPIDALISRMKRLQRRLLNSQCGANWEAVGNSATHTDYLEPLGINFYRLHSNYFFKLDGDYSAMVKVEGGSSASPLEICNSRGPLNVNSTGTSCTTITGESHTISFDCSGASYDNCSPFFISVAVKNSTSVNYPCTDSRVCRYPDMIKYTISYENLTCSGHTVMLSPILLITYFIVSILFNH